MTYAHFAIDCQRLEVVKSSVRTHWGALERNICGLAAGLQAAHVPTVYVAYVEQSVNTKLQPAAIHIYPEVNPVIGRLKTIQQTDLWEATITAHARRSFALPVQGEDWVALKGTVSVCVNPILGFLSDRGIRTVILSGLWEAGKFQEKPGCCVTASAIDFAESGFRTIIAAEATNQYQKSQGSDLESRIRDYQSHRVEVMPMRDILSLVRQAKLASPTF